MAKSKEKPKEPAVYSKAELLTAAETAFKVRREVLAGALYDVDKATKEEAEKRLNAFLKKGVK